MKLLSFRIQNVKSIVDSGKCFLSDKDNLLVLAGQNEAGKTAVLEGLNYFRNGTSKEFKRLSQRIDGKSFPRVECEFTIEEGDLDEAEENIEGVLSQLNSFSFVRGSVDKEDNSYYWPTSASAQIQAAANKIAKTIPLTDENPLEAVAKNLEQEAKEYLVTKLPDFILYSSFSDLLPPRIIVSDIPNNKAVQDFQTVFQVDFANLVKLDPRLRSSTLVELVARATLDLNSYWAQKQSTAEDDKYQYDIQVHPNEDPGQSALEFLIHRNDGNSLYLEQKSRGFQWFSSFNLRLKSLGIDAENLDNYVVLIDEPGQGLHETAQRDVKDVLQELAQKGMQIIYSTHNPNLIGVADDEILRIRIVEQTRDTGTKIYTLPKYAAVTGSKDAVSPIVSAMGISHAGQLLDSTKVSVVLEGITDQYYFSALKILLSIPEEYQFIPACGVDNIRPLVSIVLSWGGPFKVIFDDGTNGKRVYKDVQKNFYSTEDQLFKEQVRKLEAFDGIEDLFSDEDFDRFVVKEKRTEKIKNSELAKKLKKELLARSFLEYAKKDPKSVALDATTKENFKRVFDWLKA